jgi:hypothetical protein
MPLPNYYPDIPGTFMSPFSDMYGQANEVLGDAGRGFGIFGNLVARDARTLWEALPTGPKPTRLSVQYPLRYPQLQNIMPAQSDLRRLQGSRPPYDQYGGSPPQPIKTPVGPMSRDIVDAFEPRVEPNMTPAPGNYTVPKPDLDERLVFDVPVDPDYFGSGGGGIGNPGFGPYVAPKIDPAAYPQAPQRAYLSEDVKDIYGEERKALEKARPKAPEGVDFTDLLIRALAGGAVGLAVGGSPEAGIAGALGAIAETNRETKEDQREYEELSRRFEIESGRLAVQEKREIRGIQENNANIAFANENAQYQRGLHIYDKNFNIDSANAQRAYEHRKWMYDQAQQNAREARAQMKSRYDTNYHYDPSSGTVVSTIHDKATGKVTVDKNVVDETAFALHKTNQLMKMYGDAALAPSLDLVSKDVPPDMRPTAISLMEHLHTPEGQEMFSRVQETAAKNLAIRRGFLLPDETDPIVVQRAIQSAYQTGGSDFGSQVLKDAYYMLLVNTHKESVNGGQ